MDFEWDDGKALANRSKHGISFVDAVNLFGDEHVLFEDDPYPHEKRHRAIGYLFGRMVFVVIYPKGPRHPQDNFGEKGEQT